MKVSLRNSQYERPPLKYVQTLKEERRDTYTILEYEV